MYYRIADLTLSTPFPLPTFSAFLCDPAEPDVILTYADEAEIPEGPDTKSGIIVHRKLDDGWFYHTYPDDRTGLLINKDYSRLCLVGEVCARLRERERWFLRVALECRLVLHGYVSLHAAAVSLDNQAYVFSGPSQIGKSTRAMSWINALQGELVSGDRPLIHSDTLELFGVPWDGKENCCRNVHFPLKAICEVRRSETSCYIRKMNFEQRRLLLMQQSFLPMWDNDTAVIQMRNIYHLASKAEILRTFGGPGAEDAAALYNAINTENYL